MTMTTLGAVAALAAVGGLVWLVAGLVVLAFLLGQASEGRRQARLHLLGQLEIFTDWAERTLAEAPEQLPPDQELLRLRLQEEYQQAQDLLGRLR